MSKIAILFGIALIAVALIGYFGQPTSGIASAAGVKSSVAESGYSTPSQTALAEKEQHGRSPTALIPVLFGLPILICGVLGLKPGRRKHAMHAAAAIALLGGVISGGLFVKKILALFSSDHDVNRRSLTFIGLMAGLCLLYVVLSVNSFIAARRSQRSEKSA